jgi:hypothetical protein
MTDWTQIEAALVALVGSGTGIANVQWEANAGNKAYNSVARLAISNLRKGSVVHYYEDAPVPAPGAELAEQVGYDVEFDLQVQIVNSNLHGSQSAFSSLVVLGAYLELDVATDALDAAGVVFVDSEPVQRFPTLQNETWVDRATTTLRFRTNVGITSTSTYIESIEGSVTVNTFPPIPFAAP